MAFDNFYDSVVRGGGMGGVGGISTGIQSAMQTYGALQQLAAERQNQQMRQDAEMRAAAQMELQRQQFAQNVDQAKQRNLMESIEKAGWIRQMFGPQAGPAISKQLGLPDLDLFNVPEQNMAIPQQQPQQGFASLPDGGVRTNPFAQGMGQGIRTQSWAQGLPESMARPMDGSRTPQARAAEYQRGLSPIDAGWQEMQNKYGPPTPIQQGLFAKVGYKGPTEGLTRGEFPAIFSQLVGLEKSNQSNYYRKMIADAKVNGDPRVKAYVLGQIADAVRMEQGMMYDGPKPATAIYEQAISELGMSKNPATGAPGKKSWKSLAEAQADVKKDPSLRKAAEEYARSKGWIR